MISPSGKWNITSLNNEDIDMPSRKKLDFNHTPSSTTDLKKCKCFWFYLPLLLFFRNIYFILCIYFIIGFSITDGLKTTEDNTKPFVRIIQSTSLSPLNTPNNISCPKNSKYSIIIYLVTFKIYQFDLIMTWYFIK